jgi:UDP-N-acetylmuramoyl-tripeptide--D-alanyl-D-alanine ligase
MTRLSISSDIAHKLFGSNQVFLDRAWENCIDLSIDSRTVIKNNIFFALKGEFADGHDYISQAFERGAALVIAQEDHPLRAVLKHAPIIWVKDPLKCFSQAATYYLQSMPALKIALTGSNGKTTTKEMIKSALVGVLGEAKVFATTGNKNNHFGVPLSAFEVKNTHEVAIFEMGMNHSGEISALCHIVEPKIGLITNISMAHEGCFVDGIDGVQRAKGELFAALAGVGTALVNLDDARVCVESSKHLFKQTITFGSAPDADLRIMSRSAFDLASGFQEIILAIKNYKLSILCPLPGAHQASNVAAAIAVVHGLGLCVEKAALAISHMKLSKGRLSLSKHEAGFLIINDGYNANPASMTSGIHAVLELPAQRRIAVIGAMGELGKESSRFHFELGQLLAKHFEYLFICGHSALPVVDGAISEGCKRDKIIFAPDSNALVSPLKALVRPGDAVFIKGSLSANMAIVAQALEDSCVL